MNVFFVVNWRLTQIKVSLVKAMLTMKGGGYACRRYIYSFEHLLFFSPLWFFQVDVRGSLCTRFTRVFVARAVIITIIIVITGKLLALAPVITTPTDFIFFLETQADVTSCKYRPPCLSSSSFIRSVKFIHPCVPSEPHSQAEKRF